MKKLTKMWANDFISAPTRNRTLNLLIKSQLLCLVELWAHEITKAVNYSTALKFVRVQGIEPWAHGLKGRCSTKLSYTLNVYFTLKRTLNPPDMNVGMLYQAELHPQSLFLSDF